MKTLLQHLIGKGLSSGKALRDIEKESGVDHTNLSRYYNKGSEPDSKNLAKLANYFGVEFHELLDQMPSTPVLAHLSGTPVPASLLTQRMNEIWHSLPEEKQAVLLGKMIQAAKEDLLG